MNDDHSLPPQEELLELLAARAAGLFSAAEQQELERLLQAHPDVVIDELDLAAAAADLAFGPTTFEPLPASLRSRLVTLAHDQAGRAVSREKPAVSLAFPPESTRRTPARSNLAWLVAAASLAFALWGWWSKIVPVQPPVPAEQLTALLKQHPQRASLTDPANGHPHGDVFWSETEQRGYMRLRGIKPNDPSRQQYQLWIFDEDQDDRYPIDGGVFNIEGPGKDEIVIPIHAAIRVGKAKMFAITIEKPGGVVVSDRQRIAALGKIDG
jgi:anti-sigma-K factor RskA